MSFWTNLPNYFGNWTGHIALIDRLAQEYAGSVIGGIDIYSYPDVIGGTFTGYSLSEQYYSNAVERKRVYFLPWMRDHVTQVSFSDLSGYDYFLTSEFTGCRFVVTSHAVAHVAWSAGRDPALWSGTQGQRDMAEYTEMNHAGVRPTWRRKMSLTTVNGPWDAALAGAGFDTGGQSYGGARAMIFGYKVGSQWHFKMLQYATGTNATWSNFI
ncbi:MAG TPA: hypothetical protein VGC21_22765 [Telluria sp.]|jgi:hypothetical protein